MSDKPRITTAHLASQIERRNPDIVFIDYLTLMKTNAKGGSKDWLAVADLSAELKGIRRVRDPHHQCRPDQPNGHVEEGTGDRARRLRNAIGQDADGLVTMTRSSNHLLKCPSPSIATALMVSTLNSTPARV